MREMIYCSRCGKKFERPQWRRGKRKLTPAFCSPKCQLDSIKGWNKGKSGYVSEEGRAAMAENGRRNLVKETKEQREKRLKNAILARAAKPHPSKFKGLIGKDAIAGGWLDNKASYNAKHRWIQKHWVKSGKCEDCGGEPKPFGKRRYGTEWANIDGEYDRNNRATWKELCVTCHRHLDKVE